MTQQAWFCHPHDLVEEGPDAVLDRMQAGGASGVVMAALYRACGLLPDDDHGLADPDPLATARTATRARGMELSAWLVLFHSTRLGTAYPDRTRITAYGDRVLTDLCPAHPDVRAYASAVVRDVARLEPDALHLESLHHALLPHGYDRQHRSTRRCWPSRRADPSSYGLVSTSAVERVGRVWSAGGRFG